MKYFPSKLCSR